MMKTACSRSPAPMGNQNLEPSRKQQLVVVVPSLMEIGHEAKDISASGCHDAVTVTRTDDDKGETTCVASLTTPCKMNATTRNISGKKESFFLAGGAGPKQVAGSTRTLATVYSTSTGGTGVFSSVSSGLLHSSTIILVDNNNNNNNNSRQGTRSDLFDSGFFSVESGVSQLHFESTGVLPDVISTTTDDDDDDKTSNPPQIPQPSHLLHLVGFTITKHEHEELGYMQFHFDSLQAAWEEAKRIRKENALRSTSWSGQEDAVNNTVKPILAVLAKIPGPEDDGRSIFSHPLVVEAAETLFLAVNRKDVAWAPVQRTSSSSKRPCLTQVSFYKPNTCDDDDDDKETEPELLSPTLCGDTLTLTSVVSGMIEALTVSSQKVPKYLELLLQEAMGRKNGLVEISNIPSEITSWNSLSLSLSSDKPELFNNTAVFGLQDPILAEVEFAGLEGVLATRVGSLSTDRRKRIVHVTFDVKRLPYCTLLRCALQHCWKHPDDSLVVYYRTNDQRMAAQVEIARVQQQLEQSSQTQMAEITDNVSENQRNGNCIGNRKAADVVKEWPSETSIEIDFLESKTALRRTPLRFVPLTELQATRANRLVHLGNGKRFNEAMSLLSPKQGRIFMQAVQMASAQKSFHSVVDIPILTAWISLCDKTPPPKLQQTPQQQTQPLQQPSQIMESIENSHVFYEYSNEAPQRVIDDTNFLFEEYR